MPGLTFLPQNLQSREDIEKAIIEARRRGDEKLARMLEQFSGVSARALPSVQGLTVPATPTDTSPAMPMPSAMGRSLVPPRTPGGIGGYMGEGPKIDTSQQFGGTGQAPGQPQPQPQIKPGSENKPGGINKTALATAGGGALAMILGAIFGGKEGFASVGEGIAGGVEQARDFRIAERERQRKAGLEQEQIGFQKEQLGFQRDEAQRAKVADARQRVLTSGTATPEDLKLLGQADVDSLVAQFKQAKEGRELSTSEAKAKLAQTKLDIAYSSEDPNQIAQAMWESTPGVARTWQELLPVATKKADSLKIDREYKQALIDANRTQEKTRVSEALKDVFGNRILPPEQRAAAQNEWNKLNGINVTITPEMMKQKDVDEDYSKNYKAVMEAYQGNPNVPLDDYMHQYLNSIEMRHGLKPSPQVLTPAQQIAVDNFLKAKPDATDKEIDATQGLSMAAKAKIKEMRDQRKGTSTQGDNNISGSINNFLSFDWLMGPSGAAAVPDTAKVQRVKSLLK